MNYAEIVKKNSNEDNHKLCIPTIRFKRNRYVHYRKKTECKCKTCDDTECHAHFCERCGHTNANHCAEECFARFRVDGKAIDNYIDSVGVLIFRETDVGNENIYQMLMQHRSQDLMHGKNKLALIGGCLDNEGETPLRGAVREFNEELELGWTISEFEERVYDTYDYFSTRYFILKYDVKVPLVIHNLEVNTKVWKSGHVWVSVNTFLDNFYHKLAISENIYACNPRSRKIEYLLSRIFKSIMIVPYNSKGQLLIPRYQSIYSFPFHIKNNPNIDTNEIINDLCKLNGIDRFTIDKVSEIDNLTCVRLNKSVTNSFRPINSTISRHNFVPWQKFLLEI